MLRMGSYNRSMHIDLPPPAGRDGRVRRPAASTVDPEEHVSFMGPLRLASKVGGPISSMQPVSGGDVGSSIQAFRMFR